MGSEYSTPTSLPILAASLPGLRLWPEEISNVTIADVRMSAPISQEDRGSNVVWSPIGELIVPQISQSIRLQASRAGLPDLGLEARWQTPDVADENNDPVWVGWDPPTSLSHSEALWASTSTDTDEQTHTAIACMANGAIAFAYEDASASQAYVYVGYRPAGDPGAIDRDQIVAPPTDTGAGLYAYPALCAAGANRVRLYHLAHSGDVANVWVWDAAQDANLADLSSWTLASRQALRIGIDESSTPAGRIRVARSGGQYLMLIGDQQYASVDGVVFDRVGEFASLSPVGVGLGTAGGAFIVAIDEGGANDYSIYRLADAFAPLSAVQPAYTLPGGGGSAGDSVCVAALDDGAIYAYVPNPNGLSSFEAAGLIVSRDDGLTWALAGYPLTGLANGPRELAICGYRDRLYGIARRYDGASLIGLHFGGAAAGLTVPRFTNNETGFFDGRGAFVRDWSPHASNPSNVYSVATGGAGGTATHSAAGYWQLQSSGTSTADYIRYQHPQADSLTEAAVIFGGEVVSGRAQIRLHGRFAATGEAAATVQITPGAINVYDGHTGGLVAGPFTVDADQIEVAALMSGTTIAVGWRLRDDIEPRNWRQLGAWSVSTITGSSLYYELRIMGDGANAADVAAWRFSIAKTSLSTGSWGSGVIVDAADEQPIGRGYGGKPRYVYNGVSFAAAGGPAVTGEEWDSSPVAGVYAPDQMIWDAAAPSPRVRWRSAVAAEEVLAFEFGATGEAIEAISGLWALVIDGAIQAFDYAWHDGSSWGSWNRIYAYVNPKTYTRRGEWLSASSALSSGSGPYLREDELAGGFAVDASGNARRILANTAGVLGNNTAQTFKTARIRIEADGSEDSGSVSWRFVPPRVVMTLAAPAIVRGFRLRIGISGYQATPSGVSDLKLLLGPAYVLGEAHGKDTSHEYRANARNAAMDNGQRWAARAAPPSRVVSLSWQASADRLDPISGATNIGIAAASNPDYLGWRNGGSPAYTRGEMAYTLAGLVQRWASEGTPVLYLPYTQRSASGDLPWVFGKNYGAIIGTVSPTWTLEHAGSGEEMQSEVMRLGSITIEELT